MGFVWLNLQVSVSWQVDFQRGSCGSIFSFLCHGWQTFSGVFVAQSLVLCHGWQIFSGVRVAQSFVFCVMVGRLLVGFVWLNRQFSVSWQVDFVWGSCGSIQFSVSWLVDFQWGSCGSISSFLCHGRYTFSEARVAQSLVFRVMVGRLLVGFVWLNLQFCVMVGIFLVGFVCSFLLNVAQLVFCVMVGRLLVGFVWLNLLFSVSWLVDFQWGSCGSIVSFLCHGRQIFCGVRVAQSSFLCHGWQTFSGVRVDQSLGFCVMVGRLLARLVWLNLQFSVSWLVDIQWGLCGSIFSFVSWLVDFQWGSCGSIFSFLCHG